MGEGFVEITGERVAILTDMAIKADNIDEAKAEEARKRAEARLAEKTRRRRSGDGQCGTCPFAGAAQGEASNPFLINDRL